MLRVSLCLRSFIKTVGYHYCKLLSPARAMEWIYVDGLKELPAWMFVVLLFV